MLNKIIYANECSSFFVGSKFGQVRVGNSPELKFKVANMCKTKRKVFLMLDKRTTIGIGQTPIPRITN